MLEQISKLAWVDHYLDLAIVRVLDGRWCVLNRDGRVEHFAESFQECKEFLLGVEISKEYDLG
jgi:hypothetical protein